MILSSSAWLILIAYHIRMDTLETQKQFGLWWGCHSISRLKSLIQRDTDPKCRNNIVVFTNNNTKHWCKCFDTLSKKLRKQYPPKSWTISEPSTSSFTSSQRNPKASWGFPTKNLLEAAAIYVLRIHGRLRLEEPLDHEIAAKLGCPVQRCLASGAAARGQATGRTQRNEGEKNSEKILGASKVEVLEIVATQKSSLDLRSIALLGKFWWHRVGWKRPCEPDWQSKCSEET